MPSWSKIVILTCALCWTLGAATSEEQTVSLFPTSVPDQTVNEAITTILLYTLQAPTETAATWYSIGQALASLFADPASGQLLAEPPHLSAHQHYTLEVTLALAESDNTMPAHVHDAILTIASMHTPILRNPFDEKPRPVANRAIGELARKSRLQESSRETITHQRQRQQRLLERRAVQLNHREKRELKHQERQEKRMRQLAEGVEKHDVRKGRDHALSELRAQRRALALAARQAARAKQSFAHAQEQKQRDEQFRRDAARIAALTAAGARFTEDKETES